MKLLTGVANSSGQLDTPNNVRVNTVNTFAKSSSVRIVERVTLIRFLFGVYHYKHDKSTLDLL